MYHIAHIVRDLKTEILKRLYSFSWENGSCAFVSGQKRLFNRFQALPCASNNKSPSTPENKPIKTVLWTNINPGYICGSLRCVIWMWNSYGIQQHILQFYFARFSIILLYSSIFLYPRFKRYDSAYERSRMTSEI